MSSGDGPSRWSRCQPAAAIIAALSVHIDRLGRNALEAVVRAGAEELLPQQRVGRHAAAEREALAAATSRAARRALATSTSTTAAWNDGGHVRGGDLRVLAHVVHHRGLQPAEGEVETVVDHRPREGDGLGIALQRDRSIAGPPG